MTESGGNSDPFKGLRELDEFGNPTGKIDKRCHITLVVPSNSYLNLSQPVNISGRDFNNYLKLSGGKYGDVSSSATYGPTTGIDSDPVGRSAYEREALNDPCIILNMSSADWTDYALSGTKIVIENSGSIVGAGGFGGFGTMSSDEGKSGMGNLVVAVEAVQDTI